MLLYGSGSGHWTPEKVVWVVKASGWVELGFRACGVAVYPHSIWSSGFGTAASRDSDWTVGSCVTFLPNRWCIGYVSGLPSHEASIDAPPVGDAICKMPRRLLVLLVSFFFIAPGL